MFEDCFVDGTGRTSKPWTIVVSFALQCLLIGVAVLIPLIHYDVIKTTQLTGFLVAPPPPPPPPPPPSPQMQVKVVKVIPRQFDAGRLMAPKSIPKTVEMIKEDELPPPSSGGGGVVGGVPGGVPGGSVGGVIGGIISANPTNVPPPPPPPVKEVKKEIQRIRVGGNVQQAKLVRRQMPVYPPLAKQARIQGTVKFTAVIGTDGTIRNLQLLGGHPLLVPAAQEAVRQWVYQPTLLNGEPVEVITQIDVNFTLSQ